MRAWAMAALILTVLSVTSVTASAQVQCNVCNCVNGVTVCQEGDTLGVCSLLCIPNGGIDSAQDYPVACCGPTAAPENASWRQYRRTGPLAVGAVSCGDSAEPRRRIYSAPPDARALAHRFVASSSREDTATLCPLPLCGPACAANGSAFDAVEVVNAGAARARILGPEHYGPVTELGLKTDERSNVAVDASYMASEPGVFACGAARRGQSLVVWAIWEGRECARGVDQFLMGHTDLPASPLL